MTTIENPWVIVHQPGGEGAPIETLLAGPPGCKHEHFALAIADILRHVAAAFGVDEADTMNLVEREICRPTTPIVRTGPN